MTMREPVADGIYYCKDAEALKNKLRFFLSGALLSPKVKASGIIVPHDRYELCGQILGKTYAQIEIPDHIILLGPNHSMLGQKYAIDARGQWKTPLGSIEINSELAALLIENCPILRTDALAHHQEHALECQLPFLQFFSKKFQIVPLTLMNTTWDRCLSIAESLAKTIEQFGEPILIIATSNLNHYEDLQTTRKKDEKLIEKITQLDALGFFEMASSENIALCGLTPIIVTLLVEKLRGSRAANLLAYQTSADMNENLDRVVGYASILFQKSK